MKYNLILTNAVCIILFDSRNIACLLSSLVTILGDQGCCELTDGPYGACSKSGFCSRRKANCEGQCQGLWDGSKCVFPERCTDSRKACLDCQGRWYRKCHLFSHQFYAYQFKILLGSNNKESTAIFFTNRLQRMERYGRL